MPARAPVIGHYARLEPLDADRHASDLWRACDGADAIWRFMAYGPFLDSDAFDRWLAGRSALADPMTWAIINVATGRALGLLSLMEIRPASGVVEVGHILLSPALQRTCAATEAVYLAARHVFELGYRRLEWKCDDRNAPSRRAAERFGFTFEGLFRQHMIVKGENRDTAWFAMLDGEWPARRRAFEAWLAPDNFDALGAQRRRLSECGAGDVPV